MRKLILALVGLCTAVSGGRAHAEPTRRVAKASPAPDLGEYRAAPKSTVEALLGEADVDRDGRVTRTELERFVLSHVAQRLATRFQRLDRNQDGHIERNEVPSMDGARFARFDLNRDLRLVASEVERVIRSQAVARCRSVFAELDLDRDGAISAFEREASDDRQARR